MFETGDEAQETNSDCAFCHKPKFVVEKVGEKAYDLVRCAVEDCIQHCKWDHKAVVTVVEYGNKESVAIVSGW